MRTLACATTEGRWTSRYIVVPVDDDGIEAERLLVGRAEVEELQGAVDAKASLGLGVGAVELDIAERPFGEGPALFDRSGALGHSPRIGRQR